MNIFSVYLKSPQYFNKKKIWGKLKKNEPDLKWWTSRPQHKGCKIQKKSGYTLAEFQPQPQKGSDKHFFNS